MHFLPPLRKILVSLTFHVGVLCVKLIWVLLLAYTYAKCSILNKKYFKHLQLKRKKRKTTNVKNVFKTKGLIPIRCVTLAVSICSCLFKSQSIRFFQFCHCSMSVTDGSKMTVISLVFLCRPLVTVLCSNISSSPLVLHGNPFLQAQLNQNVTSTVPIYGRVLSKLKMN